MAAAAVGELIGEDEHGLYAIGTQVSCQVVPYTKSFVESHMTHM